MSSKIGGLFTAAGSSNQIFSNAANPATKPSGNDKYTGGTLQIPVARGETAQKVMNRGLYEHAKKAGLDTVSLEKNEKSAAQKFADHWTVITIAERDRTGEFKTRSPKEFAATIAHTKTVSVVLDGTNADILADLNVRLSAQRADSIQVDSSVEMTATERAALSVKASANGANSSAINSKPLATLGSVDAGGGKVKNAEDALKEHLKQNYNPNNRVWGDKINEVLAQAKQDGITIDNFELVTDENGKERAVFTISGENKAKLDKLFNDALGETITGEKGSDEGQREGTRMAADIPITLINSVIKAGEGVLNTPSFLEDVARAQVDTMLRPPGIQQLPEIDALIPKVSDIMPKMIGQVDSSPIQLPNQSDLFNKDANGKVNPNGQTLGKTASTVTSMVIPIPLANEKVLGALGTVADKTMAGMSNTARKAEQFGQEAAAGMRTLGQPEFAVANGAPTKAANIVDHVPLQTAEDLTLEARAAKAESTGARRNVEMQEISGGHTVERHVGKSESWLRNRIETDPSLKAEGVASSFRNEAIANRTQGQFIKQNKEAITNWLKSDHPGMFRGVVKMDEPIGIVVERGQTGVTEANKAKMFLVKDDSANGWHIVTSFPTK